MILYIAAGVVGVIGVLWGATRTPSTRLVVAAFLAVPQFYLPGFPVSLADVWLALVLVLSLFDKRVELIRSRAGLLVLMLGASFAAAMVWSVTGFAEANLLIIYRVLIFGGLIFLFAAALAEDKGLVARAMKWASPWVAFQSVLTVIFFYSPQRESQFLRSSAGDFLVGPQASALWRGVHNNVLDPAKAGGLFVNGNVASMFGGVAFFLLVAAWRYTGSRWFLACAAISLLGAVATGSKTGIILAVTLPLAYVGLPRLMRGNGRIFLPPIFLFAGPMAILLPSVISAFFPMFTDRSLNAYGSREMLWGGAAELWKSSPLFGLGFGGWESQIGSVIGINHFPPHNVVIAAWAIGGVVSAACILAGMAVVLVSGLRRVWHAGSEKEAKIYSAFLCAALWVFIHGMGDNTTIYGHQTTMVFLALAVACMATAGPGRGRDVIVVPLAPRRARVSN